MGGFVKKLLLLFSVIITLSHAQVDWRTRQWVINYLGSDDSTIDTVYIHYADSMFIKKLIGDWADIDTINCDTLYNSGGSFLTRIWMGGNIDMNSYDLLEVDSTNIDDLIANWAVLDTLEVEFLFMDDAGDSVWLYPNKYIMFNDSASQRDSIYWSANRLVWKHHAGTINRTIYDINMATLRDSSNINMIIGRRDSISFPASFWSPCTMLIWTNVDGVGVNPKTPAHPCFYRIYTNSDQSVVYGGTDKGALIIAGPDSIDETADAISHIILDARKIDLRSRGWFNSPGDTPGTIHLEVNNNTTDSCWLDVGRCDPGTYGIYGEATAFKFRCITGASYQDSIKWQMDTPGGVSNMLIIKDTAGINLDTTFIRGGVLHAKDSILTAQFNATNSTVDSVDAQHGVFDSSLLSQQTATVSFETATADTGLLIVMDSVSTGGGGDVAHYGLEIHGTGFKDPTQHYIVCRDRNGTARFYINTNGNITAGSFAGSFVTATVYMTTDSLDAQHGVFDVSLQTSGTITGTSVIRGQATFTRNTIVDTVAGVTGVSTNSFVQVTAKMVVPLPISWTYLNTDSILIHVLPADTVGQAIVYCWERLE